MKHLQSAPCLRRRSSWGILVLMVWQPQRLILASAGFDNSQKDKYLCSLFIGIYGAAMAVLHQAASAFAPTVLAGACNAPSPPYPSRCIVQIIAFQSLSKGHHSCSPAPSHHTNRSFAVKRLQSSLTTREFFSQDPHLARYGLQTLLRVLIALALFVFRMPQMLYLLATIPHLCQANGCRGALEVVAEFRGPVKILFCPFRRAVSFE